MTGFTIYDTDDQKSVMKEVCNVLNIDTKVIRERAILNAISSAKDELMGPDELELNTSGGFWQEKIVDAYREYQKILHNQQCSGF